MQFPLNVNIHLDITEQEQAIAIADQLTDAFGMVWKRDMDAISDFLLGHIFSDGDILASIWYFDEEAYVEELLNRGQGMTIQFSNHGTVPVDTFQETVDEAKAAAAYIENEMGYETDVYVAGGRPV